MKDDEPGIDRRTVLRNLGATAGTASLLAVGGASPAAATGSSGVEVTDARIASDEKAEKELTIARRNEQVSSLESTISSAVGSRPAGGTTVLDVTTNDEEINATKPAVLIQPIVFEGRRRRITSEPGERNGHSAVSSTRVGLQFTITADVSDESSESSKREPVMTEGYVIRRPNGPARGTFPQQAETYSVTTYGVRDDEVTRVGTDSFASQGAYGSMGFGCDVCTSIVTFLCEYLGKIDKKMCKNTCVSLIGSGFWSGLVCDIGCGLIVGALEQVGCDAVSEDVCSSIGVC